MSILITGGAGFIGSHLTKYFLEKNESVTVVDNFITGNNLVKDSLWVPLGMIFSIINVTIIKQGGKVFTISLMKAPLKQTFLNALNKSVISEEKKPYKKPLQ